MAISKKIIARWHTSDIILLGGSAGSFKLLLRIIKSLLPNLNKTIIIIVHRQKNFHSEMVKLFADNSKIGVREICDKDIIKKNMIYIAPPNYHTLIEKENYFSLDVSESVWYSKPSIDVTFESALDVYADKCTAILLSGANKDGAEGLLKLRESGALTIVQHPNDAEMPEMPQAAIAINAAEYILTTEELLELFSLK